MREIYKAIIYHLSAFGFYAYMKIFVTIGGITFSVFNLPFGMIRGFINVLVLGVMFAGLGLFFYYLGR